MSPAARRASTARTDGWAASFAGSLGGGGGVCPSPSRAAVIHAPRHSGPELAHVRDEKPVSFTTVNRSVSPCKSAPPGRSHPGLPRSGAAGGARGQHALLADQRPGRRRGVGTGRHPGPAVAAFNDLIALAVLASCRTQHIGVPDDLALIRVDDLPVSSLAVPALTTIGMDLTTAARNLTAGILSAATPQPAVSPTCPVSTPSAPALDRDLVAGGRWKGGRRRSSTRSDWAAEASAGRVLRDGGHL
ncbi:substrate-binding domain-containing protein [Streptomyces sp. NBC_00582]|uniref:substrate-binding domain-containing protein n=1 Tax=Streptomyces sp. NBC_00582 TaxID=2975783 RepID=UPI002E809FFD|nr:substrate-binding domain-containing protein [Streptomyces sp. NBC_00582]WUB66751.1 substrate-binding domain-containing protein [Streptomyces sp. NBC_00582]